MLKKALEENYKVILVTISIVFALALIVIVPAIQQSNTSNDLGYTITDSSIIALTHKDSGTLLNLEVASTPQKRGSGLMFRNSLEVNTGMFFIFSSESNLSFWMKDTSIALDIIFLDKDLKVTSISSSTKPNQTSEVYDAKSPSQFVVETLSGWTQYNNVETGDLFEITSVK